MINYREIFVVKNSFIGVIVILLLMIFIVSLYNEKGIKIIGDSFLIVSVLLFVMYLVGGIVINSFSYKFFIEVISNTFFGYIVIFSVLGLCMGLGGSLLYRYIRE